MAVKEEFLIPSSEGRTQLHGMRWMPEGKTIAVIQISHGMIEHIGRYEDFAEFFTAQGVAVVGHDHLGHGRTGEEGEFGYFAGKKGTEYLLKDHHRVAERVRRWYPGLPYFMLGHSMGSFFLRRYLTVYDNLPDGAIILGTGSQPWPLLLAGKVLASLLCLIKGRKHHSRLLHQLVLGNYNKAFRPAITASDWLSRDTAEVLKYINDPYCGFRFTCAAYDDLLGLLIDLKRKKQFHNIPRDLPILIMSGARDPVGEMGKGVSRVYQEFCKLGLNDVIMRLRPEDRHEILKELDRQQVWEEICEWVFLKSRK